MSEITQDMNQPPSVNWRFKMASFFESTLFQISLCFLIALNMITLGLETSPYYMDHYGFAIAFFNDAVLIIFAAEIATRIFAQGEKFFYDGWHIFDLVIVTAALATFGGYFQIFRILRVFWALRLLAVATQFRTLIGAILKAIPHMLTVGLILVVMIYVAALIGTMEFSITHVEEFGNIGKAMGTLTKTMLMEHTWSELHEVLRETHPQSWLFVFPVMIILNYLLLHLVIGILVTALHKQVEDEQTEKKKGFFERFVNKAHEHEESLFSHDTQAILHSLNELKDLLKHNQK